MAERRDVFQPADADRVGELRAMISGSRHGALATLEPETGHPIATRVGLAAQEDGTPLIFVSMLAAHTPALLADPRCSLLVGEVGRGDPLAHKRATLFCRAERLPAGSAAADAGMARYLDANPKAQLYAALPDFMLFALKIARASYNAGFGKAFKISADAYYGDPSSHAPGL